MNKVGKKLAILVVSIILLNVASIAVFASPPMSGDAEPPHRVVIKSLDDRLLEIEENNKLTERQKQLLVEKLNTKSKEVYESLNDASDGLRTNYSYTLYVPYQGQWQDYYCGPATVRQSILSYGVTNVPDQDQIATALGVTANDGVPDADYMIDYINSYIPNAAPYSEEHPVDIDDMIISFKVACRDYGPPVLRICTEYVSAWPYSSEGHYLNVSGAYKDGTDYSFELTDPFIGWVYQYTTGKYIKSAQIVYSAVMDHWFQGYWW